MRHVCDGGERRFGSRRETVRSATSMPSLRSSPWILGAPHSGLAAAILLTRALIAASTGGWPAGGGARRAWPSDGEAVFLPAQHGGGRHDDEGPPPSGPHSGQPDPKEPILGWSFGRLAVGL